MKNKFVIFGLVTLGVAVLGTVAYVFVKSMKNKPDGTGTFDENNQKLNKDFPLKKGSKGEKIKDLQRALNYYILERKLIIADKLPITGNFLDKTEAVVFMLTGKKELDENLFNLIVTKEFNKSGDSVTINR